MGEKKTIINQYVLDEPFQTEDAGTSRWTFAQKNGDACFIKEFFDPVYPMNPEKLSPKLVNDKVAFCRVFEQKKARLYKMVNEVSDGHLVRVKEFFRNNSHYYITTEKIESNGITIEQIRQLQPESILCLCRGIAHGLMMLHTGKIVHADIKESNVLIKKLENGQYTGKIIDFDSAFFEGDRLGEDDLGGDFVYLSPEGCRFMFGEEVKLTCKMDVFALGLLFHQYFSGDLPEFDHSEYDYAYEAVLDDAKLKLSETIPDGVRSLIELMLKKDPGERCDMVYVYDVLGQLMSPVPEADDTVTLEARPGETPYVKKERVTPPVQPKISQRLYIAANLMKEADIPSGEEDAKANIKGIVTLYVNYDRKESYTLRSLEWTSVGRGAQECQIVTPDNVKGVSRIHCQIYYDDGKKVYYVVDQSTNGTYLRGNKRLPKGVQVEVQGNSILELGDSRCKLYLDC